LADTPIPSSTEFDLTPTAALRRKPRIWSVFLAFPAALVLQFLFGSAVIVIAALRSGDAAEFFNKLDKELAAPEMFMLMICAAQLAFGLTAIGGAWLSPKPLKERLGLLPARPSWLVYPLTMFGSWLPLMLGIGMSYALALILPPNKAVESVYDNITLAYAVPFVLVLALPPGLCEELFFRGYMQRRLLECWEPGLGIVVTSTLFALIHVQPLTILTALPLGVWFGIVAWHSGSIFPAMICHAFVNGSLNAWRMVVRFAEVSETAQTVVIVASVILGTLCCLLAVNVFGSEKHEMRQVNDPH
jgi:membrane protease YdiL (CAAX protease family)